MPEAAVLCGAAANPRQLLGSFSPDAGHQGNRVELMAQMVEAVLSDSRGLSWGRVVALVTFAGTLLERGPRVTARWRKWGLKPRPKDTEEEGAQDRQLLVDLPCAGLVGCAPPGCRLRQAGMAFVSSSGHRYH